MRWHPRAGRLSTIGVMAAVATAHLFCTGLAAAQQSKQAGDLHVLRIFAEGESRAGFFTVENIGAECLWGLMYIDLSNAAGRAQMALLVNAKAQGLKLQRIDYIKNPGAGYAEGTCLAKGIHVE